jgi:hypothetical protein
VSPRRFAAVPLALRDEVRAEALPRYLTKAQAAQVHDQIFGPISPRTIRELWPLKWRIVNKKAVTETRAFLAEAQRRFDAAALIMGGKRPNPELHNTE